MNAIAPRIVPKVPASPPALPPLSRPVAYALSVSLEPHVGRGMFGDKDPGHPVAPPPLCQAEWEEAQRAAEALDELLSPVSPELVVAWLMPINLASKNVQTPDEFHMRATAIAEMVADLPGAAFTVEARRRIGGNGFFPSHAEVRAAVEPVASEWRRRRNALRGLRRARPAPPRAEPIETPEEKAASAEQNRRAVAERIAWGKAQERAELPRGGRLRDAYLSPAQLVEAYRRLGQHAVADEIESRRGATLATSETEHDQPHPAA